MEANIYIIGEIVDIKDENLKTPQYTLNDALADYQRSKDADVINLWINSPGGYVSEGTKIAELFKNSGKLIKTHNLGNVASIAFDIYLSAKRENRYYYPERGKLLIHYPWGEATGNAADFKEYGDQLQSEENKLVKGLSNELGVDESVLRGYMEQERYLTVEEVELLNIANIVKQEFKAVAKLKIDNMTEKEVKEELSGIKKMLESIKGLFKLKSLMIQDVNGAEIDIPEIETLDQLTTGVMATVDGTPANGDYTLTDGSVLRFENGNLNEIIPAENGNEEMEALKAENESLKKQLEDLTANAKVKDEEIESLKVNAQAKLEEVEKNFSEFKAKFSSEFIPSGEYKDGKQKVEVRKPLKDK